MFLCDNQKFFEKVMNACLHFHASSSFDSFHRARKLLIRKVKYVVWLWQREFLQTKTKWNLIWKCAETFQAFQASLAMQFAEWKFILKKLKPSRLVKSSLTLSFPSKDFNISRDGALRNIPATEFSSTRINKHAIKLNISWATNWIHDECLLSQTENKITRWWSVA